MFEAPFGATAQAIGDSPEVAEIRIAVLDEVKKKIQRAGGQALFPVQRGAHRHSRRAPMTALFSSATSSAGSSRRKCARACRRKRAGFRRICAWRFAPADRATRKWLRIETLAEEIAAACRRSSARAPNGARLVVVGRQRQQIRDSAAESAHNIGRLVDVYKSEGLSRRNDLAFAEDNPINRTVSREHAHIVHDKKTGEYRLFNDRWYKRGNKAENNCGLWIVRDGMGQEVHRDTRGTRLLPGDEIHLGKAVLKFQIK